MEYLNFAMSSGENHFYCHSIDAQMFIHGLGNRNFRIVEHLVFTGDDSEESCLVEDEEPDNSYRNIENDSSFISDLFEDEINRTSYLKIEFDQGGHIEFSVGQFHLAVPEGESAFNEAQTILLAYGYPAGDEIWRLLRHNSGKMININQYYFLLNKDQANVLTEELILNDTIEIEAKRDEEYWDHIEKELQNRGKANENDWSGFSPTVEF